MSLSSRLLRALPARALHRSFTSSAPLLGRAIVYTTPGSPSTVLTALTTPSLPPTPPPAHLNVRFLLSPINPADINVIEGVYPSKPTATDALTQEGLGSEGKPVFVGGNEGLAQVVAVGASGAGESGGFRVGDWVIVTKQQSGTWMSERCIPAVDVAKIPETPSGQKLTEVQAATLTVSAIPRVQLK